MIKKLKEWKGSTEVRWGRLGTYRVHERHNAPEGPGLGMGVPPCIGGVFEYPH